MLLQDVQRGDLIDTILGIVDLMISFLSSTSVFLCGGSIPWYIYIISLSVGLAILSIFVPWLSNCDDDDDE